MMSRVDFYDLLFMAGLGMFGYGLYLVSLELALVVVGAVLMAGAGMAARTKSAWRAASEAQEQARKANQ